MVSMLHSIIHGLLHNRSRHHGVKPLLHMGILRQVIVLPFAAKHYGREMSPRYKRQVSVRHLTTDQPGFIASLLSEMAFEHASYTVGLFDVALDGARKLFGVEVGEPDRLHRLELALNTQWPDSVIYLSKVRALASNLKVEPLLSQERLL